MRNFLVLIMMVTLLATACADAGDDESTSPSSTSPPATSSTMPTEPIQQGELARADVDRVTDTDATAIEIAALVTGDTEFALDLFRVVRAGGENVLLSPYSIAAALTMTYAGARGTTATEMETVLGISQGERVHSVRNELDLQITTVGEPAIPDDDREPFTIRIANSIWGQQGYPFLEEFLVLLAENYDAGMNLADFASEAELARLAINDWVEEQTEGRIVDLIPSGVVTGLTRLVLVNAIWFKASWKDQFDPANTSDAAFTTLDGTETIVPLMRGGGMMPYASGDGYQFLRIPYAGDAAMAIVLPDEGKFNEITAGLDVRFLADASAAATTRDVNLALPKFEFESQFSLSPALATLGMVEAFVGPSSDAGADFTGITNERELFIQDVVHQAVISVDETGTEAAAATAVSVGLTSVADPPVPVTIDRPFVFMIEHTGTGEILFLGQVTNP